MYKHGSVMKKCGAGLALILGSSMIFAGCGSAEEVENETSAVLVDMQQAQTGDLTLQNSFVGTVSPQESVYVIPFASGTVTEVNYSVGDYVNAGDVLFKIDDEAAQLQLKQAQLSLTSTQQTADMTTGSQQESTDLQLASSEVSAQSSYEQAQIAYYQIKNKYDEAEDAVDELEEAIETLQAAIASGDTVSGGDAATQLATLQSQLETAEEGRNTLYDSYLQAASAYRAAEAAKDIVNDTKTLTQGEIRDDTSEQLQTSVSLASLGVDSAELALSYYTVTAPISGVVTSRSVDVNSIAASSSAAFTIANENSMTVTFNVGESVKATLSVGDEITVERSGAEYTGHITEVGVAVNQQTGLFQIKANVEADGDTLPSGVSVKITADTYKQNEAIIIPYDAVYYDNDGSYVYLCVDGRAVKTYVTAGIFNDTEIAITDGIAEGDTIITSWSARLMDGAEVSAPDTINE
ncbi:MAG: efflux RND transporter periplasmic adaptor subunit [Lachnospiraceae bacterium]|nr:efflux RND transporter periplasmic adaptor subunit [Lachnospiraceae bacterium]